MSRSSSLSIAKLERPIATGRLKAAAKIGAAAVRIHGENYDHPYYDWSCAGGEDVIAAD